MECKTCWLLWTSFQFADNIQKLIILNKNLSEDKTWYLTSINMYSFQLSVWVNYFQVPIVSITRYVTWNMLGPQSSVVLQYVQWDLLWIQNRFLWLVKSCFCHEYLKTPCSKSLLTKGMNTSQVFSILLDLTKLQVSSLIWEHVQMLAKYPEDSVSGWVILTHVD